jgi:CDP-glycerol glycerophosphotransferase
MLNRLNNLKIFTKVALAKFQAKERDNSTWVFSSSFNTKFNYNSKFLFEHVLKNEPDIHPLYVINDDETRRRLQQQYGEEYFTETRSLQGIRKVLGAGVWFTSAGLPVYGLGLNRDRIIIHLGHGVPLKKIAMMENNLSRLTRLYFKYIFTDNYTHVLTTSQKLSGIMAESYGVTGDKIKVWGQPRNDKVFSRNDREKILGTLYDDLPPWGNAILYAPTFRSGRGTEFFPFPDFEFPQLEEFLEENKLVIFIRCHQSEAEGSRMRLGKRVRLMNQDKVEEIMDIINIFDLLITDYSSIYIDYLLTERPLVFLPYDRAEYMADRGMNFEYNSVTPGPKPETFAEFREEIAKLLRDKYYYLPERQAANLFFNEFSSESSPYICGQVKKELGTKKTIVSLSFDDGREDTYRVAYGIMKRYGLRGTIHVTTGYVDKTWENGRFNSSSGPVTVEQLKEMKANGFEISSHGDKHVTEKQDLMVSIKKLKGWGLTDGQAGFSIPKSQLSEQEKRRFSQFLEENGILYMRGGRSGKCYSLGSKALYALYNAAKLQKAYDLFNRHNLMARPGSGRVSRYGLPAVVIRGGDDPQMVSKFIENNASGENWIILMLHGIQNKGDENYGKDQWSWSSDKFEKLCRQLKAMSDGGKISVTTIMEAVGESEAQNEG